MFAANIWFLGHFAFPPAAIHPASASSDIIGKPDCSPQLEEIP
jgi:hypothetical protein